MFVACFFYLFWVWCYIWLQALTGFMCLWNASPFSVLTPLIFLVYICTKVCVCACLRQYVWNIHNLKLILYWLIYFSGLFLFCHHLFILRSRQYICMWEEKFWILFVTWSCMKEMGKKGIVLLVFWWILCCFVQVASRHYKNRLPKNINCLCFIVLFNTL